MYILNLYNTQAGGVSLLFLAFFEVVTVAWGYGANRFAKDVETMIGYKIWRWWPIAWKFCSPLVILGKWSNCVWRDHHSYQQRVKFDIWLVEWKKYAVRYQEPMSRSMQLHYIPVTAFS